MAITSAAAIGRDGGQREMGRVERRTEQLNEVALAAAFGALDDDDQSALVDDLRQLRAAEPMLEPNDLPKLWGLNASPKQGLSLRLRNLDRKSVV